MQKQLEERQLSLRDDPPSSVAAPKLATSNGTTVFLQTENGVEKISIRSETGQVVFEYQPETKKCWFTVPEGDLNFTAPSGDIRFTAGRGIQMKCPGDIKIDTDAEVHMRAAGQSGKDASLQLSNNGARVQGETVAVTAPKGEFAIASTTFRSRSVGAKIERSRFIVNDLEIVAETVRQKSRNVVQQVENLLQVNAGKIRTFVRGLYNLKGNRTYIKAEKDIKLKGDKIHLR